MFWGWLRRSRNIQLLHSVFDPRDSKWVSMTQYLDTMPWIETSIYNYYYVHDSRDSTYPLNSLRTILISCWKYCTQTSASAWMFGWSNIVSTSTTTLKVSILVIIVFGAGLAEDDEYIINLNLWFKIIYLANPSLAVFIWRSWSLSLNH